MSTIFIIHGTYGYPEENWFSWMKSELEKLNHKVFIPKFPTPENQSLDEWLKVFDKYKKHINKDTIVIGHSLGVAFLLSIIEKLNYPIKAAFFVSGSVGLLNNEQFDRLNHSFVTPNFNWIKIKKNCPKIILFHSDNDPYVPLKKAKELAKKLDVSINLVKDAGHFNKNAGYTKFELLLKEIDNLA